MTQFAGRRSPGPGAVLGGEFGGSGRASPGLHAPYGSGDFGGRVSPGPQAAYGGDLSLGGRATTPTPRYPGGGRVSPGPQMAYGNNVYGPR